jgi:hypothetical protein
LGKLVFGAATPFQSSDGFALPLISISTPYLSCHSEADPTTFCAQITDRDHGHLHTLRPSTCVLGFCSNYSSRCVVLVRISNRSLLTRTALADKASRAHKTDIPSPLDTGALIGIVLGGICLVFFTGLTIFLHNKRHRQSAGRRPSIPFPSFSGIQDGRGVTGTYASLGKGRDKQPLDDSVVAAPSEQVSAPELATGQGRTMKSQRAGHGPVGTVVSTISEHTLG